MSGFNFLRESELHIHFGSNRYNVKITPDLTFTQTFAEDAYSVKTLHDQTKMFRGTSITKANPADFSFSTHLTTEKDEQIILELLTDTVTTSGNQQLKSFDMLIQQEEQSLSPDIGIVTIDEKSIEKYGQWPWKRDVLAEVITNLRSSGAGVIVLPILFSEEDRQGGDLIFSE